MDKISAVLEMISTYSSTFILAALAIYVGYRLIVNQIIRSKKRDDLDFQIKKNKADSDQERDEMIQRHIENVYERVLMEWDKKVFNETNKQLATDIYTDRIERLLSRLVTEDGVLRASLFMYHNGGHDMTGRSFQKMSCTNQRVKVGVTSTQNAYQNMYKSSLHYLTHLVKDSGRCYVDNIEDIKEENYSTYDILKQNGCRRFYAVSVKNIDGYIIGFLIITLDRIANNSEDNIKLLEHIASNLEGILATKNPTEVN